MTTRKHLTKLGIVAPIAVFAALMLGAAQWVQSGSDAPAADPVQPASQAGNAAGQFSYFPAQYVNQGTEIAAHIQAF